MNLLAPDYLAEMLLHFDAEKRCSLTVSKLPLRDPAIRETVAQLTQAAIDAFCMWAAVHYGVKIQGWIGGPQPQRPELRALLETVRAYSEEPSKLRLQILRDALVRYETVMKGPG